MESDAILVRRWPTFCEARSGVVTHRRLLSVDDVAAVADMAGGRGLETGGITILDGSEEEFAASCASACVLALPWRGTSSLPDDAADWLAIALATGLPVVATTRTSLSTRLRHGREGYVAPPHHDASRDLAPAAAKIIVDPVLFARFSQGATARIHRTEEGGGVRLRWVLDDSA